MDKRIVSTAWCLGSLLVMGGCGGSGTDTESTDETVTTGGEGTPEGDGSSSEVADPCAGSTESPCETADGGVARGAEGEGTEGEGTEGEGTEGEGTEGEGTEGGAAEGGPVTEEQWTALVREGRQWFNRRCDTCHPGGEEDIGPTLRRIRWAVPRMTRQIRHGSGRMRPISARRLPDENMDALMAYLSTFGAVVGVPRPAEPEPAAE
jgi:mono/diheme cytochrome c family protein